MTVANLLDDSVLEMFSMMLGESPERTRSTGSADTDAAQLFAVLELTGGIDGSVAMAVDDVTAIRWTEALLGQPCDTADATVIDAIGEIANMVSGGLKRRLERSDTVLSLPSVSGEKNRFDTVDSAPDAVRIHYRCGSSMIRFAADIREEGSSNQ